jgi:hypothetical protein
MYLFIIVSSLSVVILAVVIYLEVSNSAMVAPASYSQCVLETAKRKMKEVSQGEFPLHILENEAAPPFDDKEYLGIYMSDINNPSTNTFIQNVTERVCI